MEELYEYKQSIEDSIKEITQADFREIELSQFEGKRDTFRKIADMYKVTMPLLWNHHVSELVRVILDDRLEDQKFKVLNALSDCYNLCFIIYHRYGLLVNDNLFSEEAVDDNIEGIKLNLLITGCSIFDIYRKDDLKYIDYNFLEYTMHCFTTTLNDVRLYYEYTLDDVAKMMFIKIDLMEKAMEEKEFKKEKVNEGEELL